MTKNVVRFVLALLLLATPGVAFGFEPTSDAEAALMRQRLIPLPVSSEFGTGSVTLDDKLAVTLSTGDPDTTAPVFEKLFQEWFGHKPTLAVEKSTESIPAEGYRIEAQSGALSVVSSDYSGAINALKTLRQLAVPNRDQAKLTAWSVPEMKISDAPKLKFRGLHLCWFPETDPGRIEQGIRMAAYYKMNYVVIETWGTYRFESHPEFGWADGTVDKAEIRRLNKIAKEQGLTLIPQFNFFGHASGSRGGTSKHAILDFHPEFLPLFEPDGWTFCLANPDTRKILTDLALELYEAYEEPPFFHIGCDEAYSAGTCPACRKNDYGKLFLDHLTYFVDLFEKRGCRPMMWHDMLVPSGGEFEGYIGGGTAATVGILDNLTKKMIICDWQYSAPRENEEWPTATYFKNKGFDVVSCPWDTRSGIQSLGANACKKDLFGLLTTTWHHFKGSAMRTTLSAGAHSAWGTPHSNYGTAEVDNHLRQVGWDMKERLGYRQTGILPWQLPPEPSGD